MSRGYVRAMFSGVSLEFHFDRGHLFTNVAAMEVVETCPNLQEICITDKLGSIRIPVVSSQLTGLTRLTCLSTLDRLIPNQLNTYEC